MTNYHDDTTYRMEHNPAAIKSQTLELVAQGGDLQAIDACLMRSAWIAAGHNMHDRMRLRATEVSETTLRNSRKPA